VVFVPFLSCYGYDSEQRCLPNGLVKFGEIFKGTPAGGLPQILLTIAGCTAGAALGSTLAGVGLTHNFPAFAFYAFAVWTFGWACGRVSSSFLNGVRTSQMLQLLLFGSVFAVPAAILAVLSSASINLSSFLNPLSPLIGWGSGWAAGVWGVVLLLLSLVGALWSERNLQKRLLRRSRRKAPAEAVGT